MSVAFINFPFLPCDECESRKFQHRNFLPAKGIDGSSFEISDKRTYLQKCSPTISKSENKIKYEANTKTRIETEIK